MAKVEFTLDEFKEYERKNADVLQAAIKENENFKEISSKHILFLESNVSELRVEIDDLEHENLLCKRAYLEVNVFQFVLDEFAAGKQDISKLENAAWNSYEWHYIFRDLTNMNVLGITEEFAYEWLCEEIEHRKEETTYIQDEEVVEIMNEINTAN